MNIEKVKLITNPVIAKCLCTIRNKYSNSINLRIAARKIASILLYEASKNLPLDDREIETPISKCVVKDISDDISIIISPILRAGLIFSDNSIDMLPDARIIHIGMYRDEETLKPVWYYNKLEDEIKNPNECFVYITDPMLATGNSMLEAIKLYVSKNIPISNIRCISMISAPQGIELIQKECPEIEIITASIDEKLNEKGYIFPGMGDAGDRIFNT